MHGFRHISALFPTLARLGVAEQQTSLAQARSFQKAVRSSAPPQKS
jgi:hypothetical protein